MIVANYKPDLGGKKKKTQPFSGASNRVTSPVSAGSSGTVSTTPYTPVAATQGVNAPTQQKLDSLGQGYRPSQSVTDALKAVEALRANAPKPYENRFADRIAQIYDAIENRDPFSFDLSGDALYRQYRDQYQSLGKLAMHDTLGKAAGLTGGYNSSYAQSVGQQTYNGYLQKLNAVVPELYSLAYTRYTDEGDRLQDQYAMLTSAEQKDYARWNDENERYLASVSDAQSRYDSERELDYDTWQSLMAFYQDQADREQAQSNHNEQMALERAKLYSKGSSSSSSKSAATEKVPEDILKMVWALYGDDDELRRYLNARVIGGWLTNDQAAALFENYT